MFRHDATERTSLYNSFFDARATSEVEKSPGSILGVSNDRCAFRRLAKGASSESVRT
jgi:hypothetical protein